MFAATIALAFALTAGAQDQTLAQQTQAQSPGPGRAQLNFKSAAAAMDAFGAAIRENSEDALRTLFGQDFRDLIPPAGGETRDTFIAAWNQSHAIVSSGDGRARIAVGNAGWTFPVPLVETPRGWRFDTHAGTEEMRLRRIGRNELAVIQTMLAIYDAQREYAQTSHDGSNLLVYASKLVSTPGKHDGLYWPDQAGGAPSPLGPAFLDAASRASGDAGLHGYRFKLLTSQGKDAPGGAYDYAVDGLLFGGFAVLAWPVKYGDTGIESFMVSHAGALYQRDLGADTARRAEAIKQFDPGAGWRKVPAQDIE
ncbi:DUF2950 domain-containing protein [Achromobacter aloeverae]|uniref:DUF2950 domain-containing protein n=2 Tax=Achromobacter aloeverae TaxID=1750518 RepID=A0A4Q1HEV1_9BURK|nr:DUF2950 domain-containing protein [Achromobacter aloeverae]